ncbi:anthrone oxygenase family protein [Pedobacter sp. FW305-3-2-15-E-R2A2]|uniref:anthrone oxygenase family protein n=1 Tax=Pedobacter sp. FW305-3-2-15-E-R2A2 TaxID=3140251 RepID=UPI003140BE72
MADLIFLLTATLTALIAGLFYAFSCAVNPGLAKLSDERYLAAMQSINKEIQNLLFLSSFMGTLLFLPVSTWLQFRVGITDSFWLLLAATFVYTIGVFGLTMFGNVPLNQALDRFNLSSAAAKEMAIQRERFEIPWKRFHRIRTVASVLTVMLVIAALVYRTGTSG